MLSLGHADWLKLASVCKAFLPVAISLIYAEVRVAGFTGRLCFVTISGHGVLGLNHGTFVRRLHYILDDDEEDILTIPLFCDALTQMPRLTALQVTGKEPSTRFLRTCLERWSIIDVFPRLVSQSRGADRTRSLSLPALRILSIDPTAQLLGLLNGRCISTLIISTIMMSGDLDIALDAITSSQRGIFITSVYVKVPLDIPMEGFLLAISLICPNVTTFCVTQPRMVLEVGLCFFSVSRHSANLSVSSCRT